MRGPHSSVTRGKKVLVILKNGERLVARFLQKRLNGTIVLEGREVHHGDIRSLSIYRAQAAREEDHSDE